MTMQQSLKYEDAGEDLFTRNDNLPEDILKNPTQKRNSGFKLNSNKFSFSNNFKMLLILFNLSFNLSISLTIFLK